MNSITFCDFFSASIECLDDLEATRESSGRSFRRSVKSFVEPRARSSWPKSLKVGVERLTSLLRRGENGRGVRTTRLLALGCESCGRRGGERRSCWHFAAFPAGTGAPARAERSRPRSRP